MANEKIVRFEFGRKFDAKGLRFSPEGNNTGGAFGVEEDRTQCRGVRSESVGRIVGDM